MAPAPPARTPRARSAKAGHSETGADSGARAKLRAASDQAVGDARPVDRQTKQRQGCENQRQRVGDGRGIVEPVGELAKDRRTDSDDHRQHQNFHTGGDDIAEHLLGEEGGAPEQAERHQHEAGKRGQLEFDQADEELDRHDKKADDDDHPGDEQYYDLH